METNQAIDQVLSELLQKTNEGKVPWVLVNPNAVRWTKQDKMPPTIVTLQKQPVTVPTNPSIRENFVLTIQAPPAISIQISTMVDQSKREIFSQLFKQAIIVANDKTIEILKSLLQGL